MKEHLLPRILEKLHVATENLDSSLAYIAQVAQNSILIKSNRVYNHKLAHFYHTTYDVRRSDDIINPKTSHCNILLLSNSGPQNNSSNAPPTHPFIYGRVIGIYHVNVVYIGPGMDGYQPMRFDFLHVRWFQLSTSLGSGCHYQNEGWASLRLDCLSFPPMAQEDSFGFVDPSLVLRACHIIPAFNSGKRYADGIGLSAMARDSNDWKCYYVNRFDK